MTVTTSPRSVLVVGSGAREHALAWRLAGEAGIGRVIAAPGNPLLAEDAEVRPAVAADDGPAIVDLCRAERVGLVVVGPETPLVAGLADRLQAAGGAVFGPSAAAARLEGSKAWCREVAAAAGLPMARGASFTALEPALAFARRLGGGVVVKADGLAAGKGVTVCEGLEEAEEALREALVVGRFGAAGERVVVEERLVGREVSLICLCDATTALALPAARDHKRLADGDRGPNTGGMGAFSPLDELPSGAAAALVAAVHEPVLAELRRRGTPFRGALYAGLMLTAAGPRLLEFNVRLGDPEAQAILPRLAVPLGALLAAAAEDRLAEAVAGLGLRGPVLPAGPDAAAAVVLAAPGYPKAPQVGDPIDGLAAARAAGALVFGAGVAAGPDGSLRTAGGRVVTVVGRGPDVATAAAAAHRAAAHVTFPGRQRRTDIGRVSGENAAAVADDAAAGVIAMAGARR